MRIIAAVAVAVAVALGAIAPAHGAPFAPPPEVTIYEGTRVKVAPMPPTDVPADAGPTLTLRGAVTLTHEHELRYWHGWHVPLRFGVCRRHTTQMIHCPVRAYLGVLRGEARRWRFYEDIVRLGTNDRVWISTVFPRPLHLTITPRPH